MSTALVLLSSALACLTLAVPVGHRAHRRPGTHGSESVPGSRRLGPRGRASLDEQFADAVDLVLLAVRCGHLPSEAVRRALPRMGPDVRPAFEGVDRRARGGERFADALAALPEALGDRAHELADAFATADRDGLPIAPVLERLAVQARHDRRRRAEARARQLPVRLAFPLVLCTLPSFVLLAVAPLLLAALRAIRR
ncbi:MAG: type II secretion system F family protein [Actinomycetota bacterium]